MNASKEKQTELINFLQSLDAALANQNETVARALNFLKIAAALSEIDEQKLTLLLDISDRLEKLEKKVFHQEKKTAEVIPLHTPKKEKISIDEVIRRLEDIKNNS